MVLGEVEGMEHALTLDPYLIGLSKNRDSRMEGAKEGIGTCYNSHLAHSLRFSFCTYLMLQ